MFELLEGKDGVSVSHYEINAQDLVVNLAESGPEEVLGVCGTAGWVHGQGDEGMSEKVQMSSYTRFPTACPGVDPGPSSVPLMP